VLNKSAVTFLAWVSKDKKTIFLLGKENGFSSGDEML